MICKNCGKEISDKSKFCGYCGAKVVEQTVQSQPEAVKESMFSRFRFNRSDLITLWKTAENPFQGSDLSFSASVVIVVLNLIANILILRCIMCGKYNAKIGGGKIIQITTGADGKVSSVALIQ